MRCALSGAGRPAKTFTLPELCEMTKIAMSDPMRRTRLNGSCIRSTS